MKTVCRRGDDLSRAVTSLLSFAEVVCFALLEKKGCGVFEDAVVWLEATALGFLPLAFGGLGGKSTLPSRIWVILSPITFRFVSSGPYLIHTRREGNDLALGFGGDPRVPVLGLNLRTLALTFIGSEGFVVVVEGGIGTIWLRAKADASLSGGVGMSVGIF